MEVSAAGVDGYRIDGIVKQVVVAEVEFGPVIALQPIWRGNPGNMQRRVKGIPYLRVAYTLNDTKGVAVELAKRF